MSDEIRDMVEDTEAHPDIDTARNMPDAADAGASLLGYAAVNDTNEDIARLAYKYYVEREQRGEEGSADGDWFRAEQEVRRNRSALNA